jgi:hypothetical protein
LTLSALRPLEVVMTRLSPLRLLFGFLLAVVLSSCAGSGTSVDDAADAAAASAAEHNSDSGSGDDGSQDEGTTDAATTGDEGGGRAGGPDPEAGGGARPGGPFDVEAFEQIGQPADEFLPTGYAACSGGRCTLVEKRVEDPDVGYCQVSSFSYDPPARPADAPASDQFIQRGTTVTVLITCPPEGTTEEGTDESVDGSTTDETTDESTDESTDQGTTDESTDEGTTDEAPPAEEPAG